MAYERAMELEGGLPLVVGCFPFLVSRERNPFADIEACAARQCESLGLPCLDLAEAFPDREIVAVGILDVAVGGGGIHCITQQEPMPTSAPAAY